MEFNLIIYFTSGLIIGVLLCFIFLRLYYSSKFTDRKLLETSIAEANELRLKIAGLPGREEVERLNFELKNSSETILAITRESCLLYTSQARLLLIHCNFTRYIQESEMAL